MLPRLVFSFYQKNRYEIYDYKLQYRTIFWIFIKTIKANPFDRLHWFQGRYDSCRPWSWKTRFCHQQEGSRRTSHHRWMPTTQGIFSLFVYITMYLKLFTGCWCHRLHQDRRRSTIHQDRLGCPSYWWSQETILQELVCLQEEGLHQVFQEVGIRRW